MKTQSSARQAQLFRNSSALVANRATKSHALAILLMASGLAAASFGFLGPAASDTKFVARVFNEGVNIKLDRSSPAYAALEDAWAPDESSNLNSEFARSEKVAAVPLVADQNDLASGVVEKITRANQRERSLYSQERASRDANAQAMAQMAAEALRNLGARFKPAEKNAAVADVKRPVQTISLSKLKMSREELLGGLFMPMARSNQTEGEVAAEPRVEPQVEPPQHAGGRFANFNQPSRQPTRRPPPEPLYIPPAPNDQPRGDAGYDPRKSAPPQGYGSYASKSLIEPPDAEGVKVHQVLVSGIIEFADGLAISNAMDRVAIYRDLDGDPAESGQVWLREGKFQILVEENIGQIVAELRTPYGDVMGRGSIDLARLPVTSLNQRRIEGVHLKIIPVRQGVVGKVVAGRPGAESPVRGAEILFRDLPFGTKAGRDGRFEETRLLEGSNAIVQVNRPGYWGSLSIANAGKDEVFEIFPDRDGQLIRQLLTLNRNINNANASMIWGRVTQGGRALAGARVELMTTADIVQPIYFNAAMVPDPNLKETSANGLYAFFPVPRGAHAVQAILPSRTTTEPLIFPTEERMVSRMDIEAATTRQAKVKVFDAFRTDYPLPAEITAPGSAQVIAIDRSGTGPIRYADARGLLILDANVSSAYEPTRVAMNRDRRTIFVPMIQSAWLSQLRGALKLNPEANTGAVVGFVQGSSPYKVALEDKSVLQSSRIVYFNSRGQALHQEFGEPGGGFAIFNVPEGLRTVAIQPSGSMKMYSSIALVESKVVSVISHWIR